jgi:DNA-binding XRE family transcriptional regulator
MYNQTTQDLARELYFYGEKTQAEIAYELGVHRKTLSYWIKQNKWRELKTASRQLPIVLRQNLYVQLEELQASILSREPGHRFPDRYEAEIQRKLIAGIKNIPNLGIQESIEIMKEFTTDLVRDRCTIYKEVTALADTFIQKKFAPTDYFAAPDDDEKLFPGEEEATVSNPHTSQDRHRPNSDLQATSAPAGKNNNNNIENVDKDPANKNSPEKDKDQNKTPEDQPLARLSYETEEIKRDKKEDKNKTTDHNKMPPKGSRLYQHLLNRRSGSK